MAVQFLSELGPEGPHLRVLSQNTGTFREQFICVLPGLGEESGDDFYKVCPSPGVVPNAVEQEPVHLIDEGLALFNRRLRSAVLGPWPPGWRVPIRDGAVGGWISSNKELPTRSRNGV